MTVGKVVDGFFVALLFSSIFVYAVFLQQTTDTSQKVAVYYSQGFYSMLLNVENQ